MKISAQKYARYFTTSIIIILFSLGLWHLVTAGWIQSKAIIAQQLLNHSWQQTLNDSDKNTGDIINKPWPWADTWPVAKLIVPEHNIEQIILAGDSGSSLAFAPGHSMAGEKLNNGGTAMISGHRDTHFKFLKNLKVNQAITIQTADKTIQYRVYDLQIVDSKTYTLPADTGEDRLVLVTCYPFGSITADHNSRYLVFAAPEYLT